MKRFQTLIIVAVLGCSVNAATILVPQQYTTIQEGINAAVNFDTVLVSPGVYNEAIDFIGKSIYVKSSAGKDQTFIQASVMDESFAPPPAADSSRVTSTELADNTAAAVTFANNESPMSVLDGFTINNAEGRGILCYLSNPIIQNCDISYCAYYDDGGGIWCYFSGAKIRNNLIHDNYCGKSGAGVAGMGSPAPEISHNEFYNNQCPHGSSMGFVAPISDVNIHHNLVRNNTSQPLGQGAIYINGTSSDIVNNTVVYNSSGITLLNGENIEIINNIVVANAEAGIIPDFADYDYNDTWINGWANEPGPNGIISDPVFADVTNHDYTLTASSPCINTGHPDVQYNDPDGTRDDMGAYPVWLYPPVALGVNLGAEVMSNVINHDPTFNWTFYSTGGSQVAFQIEVGTDADWSVAEMWATGEVVSPDNSAPYDGQPLEDGQIYYVRMQVSDGMQWGSWLGCTFRMNAVPSVPILDYPISPTMVHYKNVELIVINSDDENDDTLYYDYELYADNKLQMLVTSVNGVMEQPDVTSSGVLSGLQQDQTYWWRARCDDQFEPSQWSQAESFTTRGAGTVRVPTEFATIQRAIEACGNNDTVLVYPGTYVEIIDYLGKSLVVVSVEGPDATIIESPFDAVLADVPVAADSSIVADSDDEDDFAAVNFVSGESHGSIIDGFSIRGLAKRGIRCENSSPTIRNCDISLSRHHEDGAGIWCENSNAQIYGNAIHHNRCSKTGAGIAGIGMVGPQIYCNVLFNNISPHGCGMGFVAPVSNVSIHHNLVMDNIGETRGQGAIYLNSAYSSVVNNTVVNNTAGITMLGAFEVYIYNNIVVYNEEAGIIPASAGSDYNDVWNNGSCNDPGPNGISVDPRFVAPDLDDFSLQETSPCINAGHPDPEYNDPDGTRNDMGAFWLVSGAICGYVTAGGSGVQGVAVDLYGTSGKLLAVALTDPDGYYYFKYLDIDQTYTVSIATPLGYETEIESKTADITHWMFEVNFDMTELPISGQQRTLGYWLHQVSAHLTGLGSTQETYDDMCTYFERIRTHFNMNRIHPVTVVTMAHPSDCEEKMLAVQDAIAPSQNPSFNEQARAHLTALLLNVVSNKLSLKAIISEDSATVSQAITHCDLWIFDDDDSNDSTAAAIAATINQGQQVPSGLIDLLLPHIMYKDGEENLLPTAFALSQNYPNPFNPETHVEFALPQAAQVRLEIFNILGQSVALPVDRFMEAGYHRITWDGSKVASGVYLYRLTAGEFVESKKMVLLK